MSGAMKGCKRCGEPFEKHVFVNHAYSGIIGVGRGPDRYPTAFYAPMDENEEAASDGGGHE